MKYTVTVFDHALSRQQVIRFFRFFFGTKAGNSESAISDFPSNEIACKPSLDTLRHLLGLIGYHVGIRSGVWYLTSLYHFLVPVPSFWYFCHCNRPNLFVMNPFRSYLILHVSIMLLIVLLVPHIDSPVVISLKKVPPAANRWWSWCY